MVGGVRSDMFVDAQVGRRANMKTTGGRAIEHSQSCILACGRNACAGHVTLAVITILLVGVGIGIVLVVFSGGTSSSQYFEKLSCNEDTPTPLHINACIRLQCSYDISACEENCPFGYMADEVGCEYTCVCAEEGIFEGDIQFTEEDLPRLTKAYGYYVTESDFSVFSGSAATSTLWNDSPVNGRHKIAFEMLSVTPSAKSAITEGIKRFRDQTCVDFVERTTEERFFRFMSGRGCMSIVGRHRKNGQQVSIGKGCELPGIVQHELLHLLGFYHEHSRPDRDSYLIVVDDNIVTARLSNFRKRLKTQVRALESEYDLTSILHYPSNAFSKNGKPTLRRRRDDKLIVAQRRAFTKEDLYEVNILYDCYEKKDLEALWTVWTPWSNCDETCGLGERLRFRKCMKGSKLVSGCKGSTFHKIACQALPCPKPKGIWMKWGKFSECPHGCNAGVQWRKRKCSLVGQCDGVSFQGRSCSKQEGCSGSSMFEVNVVSLVSSAIICASIRTNFWRFGDFNGDGLEDVLCSDEPGQYKVGHAKHPESLLTLAWSGSLAGCGNGQKLVGDFNGDGKDDILCKNTLTRRIVIKFSTRDGYFTDVAVDAESFCLDPTSYLVVVYATSGDKADLACHLSTKSVEIRLNT